MLTARKSHCSLAIFDKIYAFGGHNLSGDLSSIECFDEIGLWTVKGQMRTKRFIFEHWNWNLLANPKIAQHKPQVA